MDLGWIWVDLGWIRCFYEHKAMQKPMGNVGLAYLGPPAPTGGTCPFIKL